MPAPLRGVIALGAAVLSAPFLTGCPHKPPAPGSTDYDSVARAFSTGLIALQVGEDVRANKDLTEASRLAPDEPAIWADLGLFRLRQGNLTEAATALAQAEKLAPRNGDIALLLGLLASRQGQFDRAIASFRRAAETDPRNLHARYALAQTAERQGGPTGDTEFETQIGEILKARPDNVLALLESARVAARKGDAATLKARLDKVAARAAGWPVEAQAQFKGLRTAAAGNPRSAPIEIARLRNILKRLPDFRADSSELELSDKDIAPPVTRFLKLPPLPATASAPDTGLTYAVAPIAGAPKNTTAVRAVFLDEKATSPVFLATDGVSWVKRTDAASLSLPFPGKSGSAISPDAILLIDTDSDYKTDLALAGAGGLRLFHQVNGALTDVTAKAKLPAAITGAAYTGAWAVDIDEDGDLDIVLGAVSGIPTVLRNNGDGTFTPIHPFSGVSGLRAFAGADIDGDGVADAALIDGAGALHVFRNQRSGIFQSRPVPAEAAQARAVAVADANADGLLDFVVWTASGKVIALCDKGDGADGWNAVPLFQTALTGSGTSRLLTADMDNNGGADYVVSNGTKTEVWLSDAHNALARLTTLDMGAQDIVSPPDGDKGGLFALAGIGPNGSAVLASAKGTKNYHWQAIRTRAAERAGDQRINSYGVGGEVEVRSGLLYQKMPITGPVTHFGLGAQTQADYARIVWPNGSVQGEFDLTADKTLAAEQRLKGSCPFLFAWNGTLMQFVTDCIWRSPLGLRINAQDTAGVAMTEDRVKLRGADQLIPHDGFYDLRVTADLWETHYFDHLSLMTVDHPADTEIFVDERFAIPPPALDVYAFTPPHPVASAHDDRGADMTETVRDRDSKSVDTFGRGRYQGVTRGHYLEIDLGAGVPAGKPVYLIANGWIHPTDSSINVAIAQGNNGKPSGLSLEVPDGKGGWRVARPAIGFPAGKVKTVLIRLDDVLPPGTHVVRLRTNLEIFWDQIQWAERKTDAPLRTQRLAATTAELRYRGFTAIQAKNASSPELPRNYDDIKGRAPIWRDLVGYYTRYGDVRELVAGVDDRYVIMNAGDELCLRFPVPPPPPSGWKRDFVMISDGWEKDGDYNTGFSKTVLPLPAHNNPSYSRPPTRLEDDPVYRAHPGDWETYHTRYVTPQRFVRALKPEL